MTKYAPHTSTSALTRARAKVKTGATNQVGMCAHEVIVNILGIPGPWKWGGNGRAYAVNYFLGAQKVVKTSDPAKAPAGAVVIWGPRRGATTTGGLAGHIAIGDGGGYCNSTDLPRTGHWGRVKISDVTRLWGKPLLGYVLIDGMGYTLTDKPAPKPKEPKPWFGIDYRNFSGFDVVHGKATFDSRLGDIIKDIHTVNRTFVCAVEIPDPKVAAVTAAMKKIGYDHLAGNLGRHIFAHNDIKADASKMFDLKPRLKNDTKQGVGVIAKPTGDNQIGICTAQLENEDATGKTQVGQADNLIDQFEAWCDSHKIPDSRRFYALDTNSDNRVRDEVFAKAGYVDAFDVAWSSENSIWRSIVKWFGTPTKGKRIDLIAVRKGRPVRRARLRLTTSNLNDHLDMFVDVGSL